MSEYRMKEILDEAHQQRERAERAEAECERLRADNEFLRKRRGQLVIERDQARGDLPEVAPSPDSEPAFLDGDFTLSLRELQHGLNCLSVDNAMDRPDFQLAWDIYEAAKQCATPPPEGEPENDGCELCGRSPDEIADAGCCQIAPQAPEQTGSELEQRNQTIRARYGLAPPVYPEEPQQAHGDALAVVERIEGNLCGPSGRLNEPAAHIYKSDLDCIRQALASAPAESDDSDIRTDHGIPS